MFTRRRKKTLRLIVFHKGEEGAGSSHEITKTHKRLGSFSHVAENHNRILKNTRTRKTNLAAILHRTYGNRVPGFVVVTFEFTDWTFITHL